MDKEAGQDRWACVICPMWRARDGRVYRELGQGPSVSNRRSKSTNVSPNVFEKGKVEVCSHLHNPILRNRVAGHSHMPSAGLCAG